MTDLEFSDSVLIAQTPGDVYAMVSDVTRMGEWSPVCRECWWEDGESPAGSRAGAWFVGRNVTPEGRSEATGELVPEGRSEATGELVPQRTWETRSQVVTDDRDRAFAWEVNDGWVHWGFDLESADGGTRLTQSWKFLPKGIAGFHERFGSQAEREIAIRSEAAKSGIPQTLAAIKASAEA